MCTIPKDISVMVGTFGTFVATRNLSSHIDLQTHAGSAFDNRVTLPVDLLTSGSK